MTAGSRWEVVGEMNAVVAAAAPLVGRDAELRVLRTVLPRVLENQAQVLAVSGQAGVGKSRLAQECMAVARDRGFLPLAGAGGALQQDLAYAPLVEALRPLVCAPAEPGRSALVEGLPDLGRLFGDLSLPPSPELRDPGLERTRMFESVCRLLERASARQPVVLLLDDAHWADRGSLALLHYLVRGLAGRPILAILTYRDDEADEALGELLAGLRRAGALTELPLTGLSDEAVGLLAHNLLDGAVPAGLLDVLTSRSGGLPLFVDALVGSFVESGALYRYEGLWALAPEHAEAVPDCSWTRSMRWGCSGDSPTAGTRPPTRRAGAPSWPPAGRTSTRSFGPGCRISRGTPRRGRPSSIPRSWPRCPGCSPRRWSVRPSFSLRSGVRCSMSAPARRRGASRSPGPTRVSG